MAIDALAAAKAYADSLGRPAPATGGADFSDMVADAVATTENTLKTAETTAAQAASGQAGLVDMVTALSAAEATLETVVTVRNEVVKAYQEILRMPV